MIIRLLLPLALLPFCVGGSTGVEPPKTVIGPPLVLVEGGQPKAEIVIAAKRPRMVTLAALELQQFLHRMSGARLPIVTSPTAEKRIRIHVGASAETDRLGVTAEGLRDGAYRIATGPDWIVLIGRDVDFDPTKVPQPLSRKDTEKALEQWKKDSKGQSETSWGTPFGSQFKHFWNPVGFHEQMRVRYGQDFTALWTKEAGHPAGFWNHDTGGSLNAVHGLLRRLGVRWYMPGELGGVVPTLETVSVTPWNETVKPDFAVRDWNWYNFSGFAYDDIIWARRLGMNTCYETLGPCKGPHGLVPVHSTAEMKKAHPEYYALIGGQRDITHRDDGTPCWTSKGLQNETVKYIRFLYDRYDLPSVDIWPVDGLRLCQCETCKGKTASDLVWGFADAVAREVYKTHPDRRVTCGAYTSYSEAPDSIQKFSPNLGVWISNAHRPKMEDPEHWAEYMATIAKWTSKIAPGNILRLENNRYHIWGDGPISYPVLHPRGVSRDLKALKGISLGDTGEQSQANTRWRAPALEHITLYVQSRFLWDASQDVDAVLDEYCAAFYGPAAKEMKEAITFAEQNLAFKDQSRRGKGNPMNVSLAVSLRFRDLLEKARKAAGDTIHGKRIDAIISELMPREKVVAMYREREEALAQARARAPIAIGANSADLGKASEYTLKDNQNGAPPAVKTTFRAGWDRDAILFDIVCHEPEMAKLKASDDVSNGDYVAISIETPLHSYYHIEISPDGKLAEGNPGPNWKSLAEIKTERGADSWRVRVRIPVVGETEANSDPRHRVAGVKPTEQAPWHVNVGRNRVLDFKKPELQAFSPTKGSWHQPEKFGKLVIK